jgi:hypothetical protein
MNNQIQVENFALPLKESRKKLSIYNEVFKQKRKLIFNSFIRNQQAQTTESEL